MGKTMFVPIPNNGDLKQHTNYGTMAFISQASKVPLKKIMKRLERKIEEGGGNVLAYGQEGLKTIVLCVRSRRTTSAQCGSTSPDLYSELHGWVGSVDTPPHCRTATHRHTDDCCGASVRH
ncbi:hypothetical protein ElyMa_002642800 [Elysia marginata]|uniref:Uncharacterized protein n=1 Tax=Elysia marginata TaxID=1093978 RepID=A0AAV4H8Q9_9GAST|nr:hypothetical protein ElyMa_002642800 [Elysia marginata]